MLCQAQQEGKDWVATLDSSSACARSTALAGKACEDTSGASSTTWCASRSTTLPAAGWLRSLRPYIVKGGSPSGPLPPRRREGQVAGWRSWSELSSASLLPQAAMSSCPHAWWRVWCKHLLESSSWFLMLPAGGSWPQQGQLGTAGQDTSCCQGRGPAILCCRGLQHGPGLTAAVWLCVQGIGAGGCPRCPYLCDQAVCQGH